MAVLTPYPLPTKGLSDATIERFIEAVLEAEQTVGQGTKLKAKQIVEQSWLDKKNMEDFRADFPDLGRVKHSPVKGALLVLRAIGWAKSDDDEWFILTDLVREWGKLSASEQGPVLSKALHKAWFAQYTHLDEDAFVTNLLEIMQNESPSPDEAQIKTAYQLLQFYNVVGDISGVHEHRMENTELETPLPSTLTDDSLVDVETYEQNDINPAPINEPSLSESSSAGSESIPADTAQILGGFGAKKSSTKSAFSKPKGSALGGFRRSASEDETEKQADDDKFTDFKRTERNRSVESSGTEISGDEVQSSPPLSGKSPVPRRLANDTDTLSTEDAGTQSNNPWANRSTRSGNPLSRLDKAGQQTGDTSPDGTSPSSMGTPIRRATVDDETAHPWQKRGLDGFRRAGSDDENATKRPLTGNRGVVDNRIYGPRAKRPTQDDLPTPNETSPAAITLTLPDGIKIEVAWTLIDELRKERGISLDDAISVLIRRFSASPPTGETEDE